MYVLGAAISSWRILAGVFAGLPVLTFVAVLFLKESPLYLVSKGKEGEAAASLRFFRGTDNVGFVIIAITFLQRRTLYYDHNDD